MFSLNVSKLVKLQIIMIKKAILWKDINTVIIIELNVDITFAIVCFNFKTYKHTHLPIRFICRTRKHSFLSQRLFKFFQRNCFVCIFIKKFLHAFCKTVYICNLQKLHITFQQFRILFKILTKKLLSNLRVNFNCKTIVVIIITIKERLLWNTLHKLVIGKLINRAELYWIQILTNTGKIRF